MERLGTAKIGWQKLRSTNDSSSSFASRIPTITKPTANVIDRNLTVIENTLMIVWIGTGADDTTFDSIVTGWNVVSNGTLWIPTPLAQFSLTLGTSTGVAGSDAVAADRFADTITAASWNPSGGSEVVNPAGNLICHAVVDVKGCDLVQIDFDMTGATDGNAFVRWL